jgi:hypothetical protein
MNAMFTNRVGDFFLTLGFFAIFFTFGTLDYAIVFSLAPYINTNVITLISILLLLGAAAKSAQLGLHIWLPYAMEGWQKKLHLKNSYLNSFNILTNYDKKVQIFKYSTSNKSKWIYDAIIGDLLGDGHIIFHGKSKKENNENMNVGNTRMEFTFSRQNLPYLQYLKFVIYKDICTTSLPTPWPNPKTGKLITQYWFSTRSLPLFTKLHKEWYKEIEGKYIKILPFNIEKLLKAQGLAHWIMGDGFWNKNSRTIHLCTDNFTFEEVNKLAEIINNNFSIDTKVINRISDNGNKCWRIKISANSVQNLRDIIGPYMIPEMLYKLGM